jgi:hypothetical protein
VTHLEPWRRLRRPDRFLLAITLAVAWLGALAMYPAPVAAARPDLTMVGDASYVVVPDESTVRVRVDLTATNNRADTATRRYYFDEAFLAVQPGTEGFAVSSPDGKPTVRVSKRTEDYTLLRIAFGSRLFSGRSTTFSLTFELPDPGGSPDRDVRVGQALVTFPIWAFATDDTPGGSVTLTLAGDYEVGFAAGSLDGPSAGPEGSQVFSSGTLADPLDFFAYVVADRPGAYASRTIEPTVLDVAVPVSLQAWVDDPAWAERVEDLFVRGLPVLGDALGVAYPPRDEPLVVREGVSRTLGGYAGIFDPAAGRIDVDYAAGPYVILHEAAHIWFNGAFLTERWANEGFASYYAGVASAALDVEATPDALTPEVEAARIPLNAWGAVGIEADATEDYGYAASLVLADAIAERAGPDGLRDVWAAIAAGEAAYQPRHGDAVVRDPGSPAPDWRGFLDLLEERTGTSFDDLWRRWVVRDQEAGLLDRRAAAREEHARVADLAGDWELPDAIRAELASWRFSEALGLITQASSILEERTVIEERSDALGLEPPAALRERFEGGSLRAADAEARSELAALDALELAEAAHVAEPTLLGSIGLIGEDPETDLLVAEAAFESGDAVAAVEAADRARASWEGAEGVGIRRAISGAGVVLLLSTITALLAFRIRSRRRAARAAAGEAPVVAEAP